MCIFAPSRRGSYRRGPWHALNFKYRARNPCRPWHRPTFQRFCPLMRCHLFPSLFRVTATDLRYLAHFIYGSTGYVSELIPWFIRGLFFGRGRSISSKSRGRRLWVEFRAGNSEQLLAPPLAAFFPLMFRAAKPLNEHESRKKVEGAICSG